MSERDDMALELSQLRDQNDTYAQELTALRDENIALHLERARFVETIEALSKTIQSLLGEKATGTLVYK